MNIVLCIDNNYIMPCGITMISILENNRDLPVTFHIIGMDLSEKSKDELSLVLFRYPNSSLFFYDIKTEFLESYNFSLYGFNHLSLASYSRLFIADILPRDINKVLYLDSDIIVSQSLSALWNTDIDNYAVAGVPDMYCTFYANVFEVFGYSDSFKYVNAGVLLINLKYWREENLMEHFINFYNENHERLLYHDQDIINGTLYDSKLALPIKYNALDFYFFRMRHDFYQYQNEIDEAMKAPVIIHYTSPDKPWIMTCEHPLKKEFLKYKKLSPWRKVPLIWNNNESLSKKIKCYKRAVLYALGLKDPKKYLRVVRNTKDYGYEFK